MIVSLMIGIFATLASNADLNDETSQLCMQAGLGFALPSLVCILILCLTTKKLALVDLVSPAMLLTYGVVNLTINWFEFTGEVTSLHRQMQVFTMMTLYLLLN